MHHCAPPYLTNLIPNRVRDIVDHNLRNKDDFRNNRPRTEKYKHSIFMDVSDCGITYQMMLKT